MENVFGQIVAHVKMIYFQKRGLPHAHCIVILSQASKNALRNPARVDAVISAELEPEHENELRESVHQHIIHNPCGSFIPYSVGMGDWACKKKISKSFRRERQQSESEHYVS